MICRYHFVTTSCIFFVSRTTLCQNCTYQHVILLAARYMPEQAGQELKTSITSKNDHPHCTVALMSLAIHKIKANLTLSFLYLIVQTILYIFWILGQHQGWLIAAGRCIHPNLAFKLLNGTPFKSTIKSVPIVH
jgi:hypothetical protein